MTQKEFSLPALWKKQKTLRYLKFWVIVTKMTCTAKIYTHVNTYKQIKGTNSPSLHAHELWKEARAPEGNPCGQEENMHTSHRQARISSLWSVSVDHCTTIHPSNKPLNWILNQLHCVITQVSCVLSDDKSHNTKVCSQSRALCPPPHSLQSTCIKPYTKQLKSWMNSLCGQANF